MANTRASTQGIYTQDGIILVFPYSASMVEALKDRIPYRFREWRPETKTWWVARKHQGTARVLLLKYFPRAEFTDFNTDDPPRSQNTRRKGQLSRQNNPYAVLHILNTAPASVVDAAYRALSKAHHPDLGGDEKIMRQLNRAYAEIVSTMSQDA